MYKLLNNIFYLSRQKNYIFMFISASVSVLSCEVKGLYRVSALIVTIVLKIMILN